MQLQFFNGYWEIRQLGVNGHAEPIMRKRMSALTHTICLQALCCGYSAVLKEEEKFSLGWEEKSECIQSCS